MIKKIICNTDNVNDVKSLFNEIVSLKKNYGVFIFGQPGVGKTFFAKKILDNLKNVYNEIFINQNIKNSFFYIDVHRWISDIVNSWKSESYNSFKVKTNANLLILDDLGSEFFHESTSQNILSLFDDRYSYLESFNSDEIKNITIITSNYSLDELKNKYKKLVKDDVLVNRILSRINGCLNLEVKFIGEDKRKFNKD
ncbi:hypothetical protein SCORR_v1c10140 (plasmid) [Spiroplasma corruscae]|uniref:IstB-like ATP-binding domain-containing protein n=1 Tax=Spiroplasma corruscae TaxID=216934 RepID=A0A222EQT8_9MOLU|nr:ATP-binding protein [Spiroplasma corruscae]ASP28786.1 hypothetical protein SCORR_v1c10140 [Spiroplasma corruscae]